MIDHVMLEAIEKWAEIHAQEFTTVARDSENKIMFCLPIPGYKEDLSAEDGVDKATEAWWEYVISQMTEQLTETKKTYRTREKPVSWRLSPEISRSSPTPHIRTP